MCRPAVVRLVRTLRRSRAVVSPPYSPRWNTGGAHNPPRKRKKLILRAQEEDDEEEFRRFAIASSAVPAVQYPDTAICRLYKSGHLFSTTTAGAATCGRRHRPRWTRRETVHTPGRDCSSGWLRNRALFRAMLPTVTRRTAASTRRVRLTEPTLARERMLCVLVVDRSLSPNATGGLHRTRVVLLVRDVLKHVERRAVGGLVWAVVHARLDLVMFGFKNPTRHVRSRARRTATHREIANAQRLLAIKEVAENVHVVEPDRSAVSLGSKSPA
eukprot:2951589-Prymnesium_polylepis.1